MTQGLAYLGSVILLSLVVASTYTAARDANLHGRPLIMQFLRRLGKLLGVLVGLALVVYLLGKI